MQWLFYLYTPFLILLAIISTLTAFPVFLNTRALAHFQSGELLSVWLIFKDLQIDIGSEQHDVQYWSHGWAAIILLIFSYSCLWLLGYVWYQYHKSLIPKIKNHLEDALKPSDILYLRPFKEDKARLSGRALKPSRWLFSFYDWSYTYEELLAERLQFVGLVYKLEGGGWPGAYEMRASANWKHDVQQALPIAKMILVTIGETESLGEEIRWIKKQGHLPKTLFLMPPTWNRKIKKIWKLYTDHLLKEELATWNPKTVKESRILAFLFVNGKPIFLTASKRSGKYYQSALDIGVNLILNSL